ncbi:MAG: hypothetical protein ACR2JS_05355, partial [Candidatus Nanopelagicales bacterium]
MPEIDDYERLADESDMATLREGQFLSVALDKVAKAKPVEPTGFCLDPDCEERFLTDRQIKSYRKKGFPPDAKRFCDSDCRDGFEK